MPGPLSGVRVLDIATIVAAPSAAALLADYGADVVKLELPGGGDGARGFPPFREGKPLWWKVINRNKSFGTLDLRKPAGADLLKRMLPSFDVLIENFRPGTLDRWGLSRDELWSANPRLVILRATGFGQDGPYRNRPGFARVFEAMGGLTYITGEPDGQPMHTGYPLGDAIGGLFGALGVLAALQGRVRRESSQGRAPAPVRSPGASAPVSSAGLTNRQGEPVTGEEIDLSLTEAVLKLLDFVPIEHDQLGSVRERSGNANQYSAPASVYRTRDQRWVSLSGSTEAMFANNCRAIGRPDLIEDPRFKGNANRVAHGAELNGIFANWCAQHDLDQVLAAFERAQGTLAAVYSIEQIFADPQMQAREAICAVPDHDFGSVRMQNVVPRFHVEPGAMRRTGGELGEDNARLFGEALGLSPQELDDLRRDGVI